MWYLEELYCRSLTLETLLESTHRPVREEAAAEEGSTHIVSHSINIKAALKHSIFESLLPNLSEGIWCVLTSQRDLGCVTIKKHRNTLCGGLKHCSHSNAIVRKVHSKERLNWAGNVYCCVVHLHHREESSADLVKLWNVCSSSILELSHFRYINNFLKFNLYFSAFQDCYNPIVYYRKRRSSGSELSAAPALISMAWGK